MTGLDSYDWVSMTAQRKTSDICWGYDITLHGSTYPPMFRRLEYTPPEGFCGMLGDPVGVEIENDYPGVKTTLEAYSYGYYLKSPVGMDCRQSRVGVDIQQWERYYSNYQGETLKTDAILSYENPCYYLMRMLWPLDANGNITSAPGYFNLYYGNVAPVPNWGGYINDSNHPSVDCKQFFYDLDSIKDIISDLSDHCHMVAHTKFYYIAGQWREYFYWVPKYRIDETLGNYLGLPTSPVVITPTTAQLVGSPGPSASISLEDSFNQVIVEACRVKDSAWFIATRSTAAVLNGAEVRRPLYYRTHSLLPNCAGNTWGTTQSAYSYYGPVTYGGMNYGTYWENLYCQQLTDAKADELLAYMNYQIPTYTATFIDLSFELYQMIQFVGFTGFPTDIMRIIEIQYDFNPPDEGGHTVTITCAVKTTLQASGKFQSVIDEIQESTEALKITVSDTSSEDALGVVISTYDSGTLATFQLRSSGALIKTRAYGLRASPYS